MDRNKYINSMINIHGNGYYFIVRDEKVIDCVLCHKYDDGYYFVFMGNVNIYRGVEELNTYLKSEKNDLFVYYTTINHYIK